jgi:hypothetical protein
MNLHLLPKDIQNLIGEFNVEHRPKMRIIMDELLIKQEEFIYRYYICHECGLRLNGDKKYSKYMNLTRYSFCSEECFNDTEMTMYKSYFQIYWG